MIMMDPNGITSFQGGLSVPWPLQKVVLKRLGVKKNIFYVKLPKSTFTPPFVIQRENVSLSLKKFGNVYVSVCTMFLRIVFRWI